MMRQLVFAMVECSIAESGRIASTPAPKKGPNLRDIARVAVHFAREVTYC